MSKNDDERNEKFWKNILEGNKILTDKEAEELKAVVRTPRKRHGFT